MWKAVRVFHRVHLWAAVVTGAPRSPWGGAGRKLSRRDERRRPALPFRERHSADQPGVARRLGLLARPVSGSALGAVPRRESQGVPGDPNGVPLFGLEAAELKSPPGTIDPLFDPNRAPAAGRPPSATVGPERAVLGSHPPGRPDAHPSFETLPSDLRIDGAQGCRGWPHQDFPAVGAMVHLVLGRQMDAQPLPYQDLWIGRWRRAGR